MVGATRQAVAKMQDKGTMPKSGTYREWILAYCKQLRGQASGHVSEDGIDLTRERALTERVDRQIKELTLAEKLGQLVPADQVEDHYRALVTAARSELMTMADRLKAQLDTLHGIDSDSELIRDHVVTALQHLAGYQQDAAGDVSADRGELPPAA